MAPSSTEPLAVFGDRVLSDLLEVSDDVRALDSGGRWAVVFPFDGPALCARFGRCDPRGPSPSGSASSATLRPWVGVEPGGWRSSLDETGFRWGVAEIVRAIEAGELQQVNLTRVLDAPLPAGADVMALGAALRVGNPSPYPATIRLPDHAVHIASASPELFLERDGDLIRSSPIKGTAPTPDDLLAKDHAENLLVTDLVAAEFGAVCRPGSVEITGPPRLEDHPGLVHLVSTVEGRLRDEVGWAELLDATLPPASVTGVPRAAARSLISRLEPVPRGPYCGAVGWVDADRRRARIGVAIRTFWFEEDRIRFGTGGGITAASDPLGEWAETELKAHRLLGVAEDRAVTA